MIQMYQDYLKEREEFDLYFDEYGFASYKIYDKAIYLRDLYVKPEARKRGHAKKIGDVISGIGRDAGCTILQGTVNPILPTATASISVLISYGMKLKASDKGCLIFEKEI